MNLGQFNGFAINGKTSDPEIRIRVDAKGYARVKAGGRVLAYGAALSKPAARQVGAGGRVHACLSADALARAAIDGLLGHVDIHGMLQATGRARIKVTLPPVYGRITSQPRAHTVLAAHVLARSGAVAQGLARFTPAMGKLTRGPVKSRPQANATAHGTVYVRRVRRAPVDAKGLAYIVSRQRVDVRLAALLQARARGVVRPHYLARGPVLAQGVAHIEIDPTVNKRLPFDEPANEWRVFTVPAGSFTFHVTE